MKRAHLSLAVIAGGAIAFGAGQGFAEAGSGVTPGKYRSTVTFSEISIPNLPPQVAKMMQGQMKRGYSTEFCITPEQAQRPSPETFGARRSKDCKYEKFSMVGGKADVIMVCNVKGQGKMRSHVTGTFGRSSYTMYQDTTINNAKTGTMRMKGTVSGKHLGAC